MGFILARDMLVLFSGFLGVLLAAYLLTHPGDNRRASQLLASFLLLQAFAQVVSVVLYHHLLFMGMETAVRALFYLECLLLLLEGLLLYAYCQALLLNHSLSFGHWCKHLGVGLGLVGFCVAIFTQTDILAYFNPAADSRPWVVGLTYSLLHLLRVYYGWLCLQLVTRYQQRAQDLLSNPNSKNTSWLFTLIKGSFAYRLGWFFFNLYFTAAAFYNWHMPDYSWFVGGGMILLDLTWLGVHIGLLYFGFKYSGRFLSLEPSIAEKGARIVTVDPVVISKLEAIMLTEKPYTNPDLKLDDLAAMIAEPGRELSSVINRHYNTNFCEFINRHRIHLAKEMLLTKGRASVLDIAHEVGFNSKSAFNRAFKAVTGLTPLKFKNQNI